MRDDPASPILVVSFGRMGDIVRSFSVVRMLRERHPQSPIDFLGRPPADELARFVPEIRDVYVERTPHKQLGLREKLAFARRMRGVGYGRAYVLSTSFKSALTPYMARIPERIGYLGEGRFVLINRVRRDAVRHAHVARQLSALALEPGEALPPEFPLPRMAVDPAHLAEWRARENVAAESGPVLAIAPGATYHPRRWPIERYCEIARRMHARGWSIWVLTDRSEQDLADAIRRVVPVRDFAGNSVTDMVFKMSAATAFLGNESGPLHVAAALGIRCYAILGLTGLHDFAPLNRMVVIEPPPEARAEVAPLASDQSVWLRAVTVDQVDAALRTMTEISLA